MSSSSVFKSDSFTNSIGQTINPGDRVVAVTTGYSHRVNVYEGQFGGVFYDSKNRIVGTRVTNIPVKWNERVFTENGEHEEYKYEYKYDANGRYQGYEKVKTGRRYNLEERVRYRNSALQRNRIFKIDTHMKDVKI